MRAIVYKGPNEVSVENVPDPRIESPTDAIVRITSAGICGSDLHMYEGRTRADKENPIQVIEELVHVVNSTGRIGIVGSSRPSTGPSPARACSPRSESQQHPAAS